MANAELFKGTFALAGSCKWMSDMRVFVSSSSMCQVHDWSKPCSTRIHVGFGARHVEHVGLITCGCEHRQGKASQRLMA